MLEIQTNAAKSVELRNKYFNEVKKKLNIRVSEMIIQYENIKLNFEHLSEFEPSKKTILFLHGFTGSTNDWKDVVQKIDKRFNKTALDLIGHGKSSSPSLVNYYMADSLVIHIEQVINHLRLKEVILCGYSMGGRVALNFAVAKPYIG